MQATKEKGYTLIELIAVISLLMLLSVPVISYANIENLKADFAVRRYVSDIRYVYNKNTFGDIDCYLKYIYSNNEHGKTAIGYFINEKNTPKKTVYFPSNLKISNETDTFLKFGVNGTLTFSGETVYINNINTNDIYKVTIVPISGRVAVYKNED
ncbi:pilus assembly FimT family protein [Acetoanaerobium noterae]|jgi:Tfp pilus assembly protein FimT|uniref:pilus assembly FimT family protein n=1 Tax=Acetoanaerobium noterae TaxID=745369 RepID=UPI001B65E1D8|nr:prepilin-type N-terminal cleavage/methylation domain-containing protein [Acetoanaerobium sp.]MBP9562581.1 prepilin-type N-terminal cleavage/methylation domain-containing protein [Acetoanaerobium sp.]